MAIRAAKGLSQKDIAVVMGHGQSKISKLESGIDDDLRLGELAAYLEALGYSARIVVTKPANSIADEIKYHWYCLGKLLDRLLDLAHKDADIAVGIGKFANDVGYNFMSRIFGFMKRLPSIAREKTPAVTMQVERIGDAYEEDPDDAIESADEHQESAQVP
jgi:transcriptional regulator with XRE-family HTH domain